MSSTLLEIQDLSVSFQTPQGARRAVEHVSFSMGEGETLGLVGESGCGKSVTALSILGLVDRSTGKVESGRILFNGENLQDDYSVEGSHTLAVDEFTKLIEAINTIIMAMAKN